MPYKRISDRRASCARYKQKHKETVLNGQRRRWRANKVFIQSEREKYGCKDCGETHVAVLDFHHLGNKTETVSRMCVYARARIIEEIKQCIVLCANCHRKRHFYHNASVPKKGSRQEGMAATALEGTAPKLRSGKCVSQRPATQ